METVPSGDVSGGEIEPDAVKNSVAWAPGMLGA